MMARVVFVALFLAVSALGFWAARWRRPATLAALEEWGLGGRGFGVWITWFLIGGDFYTAYTVIAVPALVYATGALGFFALPYATLLYPFAYVVLPLLWRRAAAAGHVTAGDLVRGRFRSRGLEAAIAVTGIVATMPYIALQLVGMQAAIRALGIGGDLPLIAAFLILALYTYSAGLRAPALIAFVKDLMIWIVVAAALALVPLRFGGYAHVFAAAGAVLRAHGHPGSGLLLAPGQALPYATLAVGSALAAFLYPHTFTAVLAANSEETLRRNAMLLPAYNVVLGLLALLGYVAYAAGVHPASATGVVPALFTSLFPGWFAGFALSAIAIGALVPAAVMSIGAANLFTRNLYMPWVRPAADPARQAAAARLASLVVKLGALLAIVFLPTRFAIDLQLLGGVWVLQTLPSVLLSLSAWAPGHKPLLAGWVVGMALGSSMAFSAGLRPVHVFAVGGHGFGVYIGLIALVANLAVVGIGAVLGGAALPLRRAGTT
jgi:SSS family solute:Na+ symporter